jgi:hypothetical protein
MGAYGYLIGNLVALGLQATPLVASSGDEAKNTELIVEVPVSLQARIGPKKAGLLCLPDGRFALQDFIPSESYLRALVLGILQQTDGASAAKQGAVVILRDIKVNLCARDYLFSKAQYEGTVSAVFEIKSAPDVSRSETIRFKIEKGHAQSLAQIMVNIAQLLVGVLAENN